MRVRISDFVFISAFALRISRFRLVPALLLALTTACLASAQTNTNTVSRLDYSNFKVIPDRNIFNPHRRAGEIYRPGRQVAASRVDSFSLVGTMSYPNKGPFAFFEGSSSEYRKVLKPGDSIAGYKVTKIQPNFAKLAHSTDVLELRVGMQLRREDNGNWHLAGASEIPLTSPNSAANSVSRRGPPGTLVSSAGGTNAEPAGAAGGSGPQMALTDAPPEAGGTNAEPAAASDSTETDPVLRRLIERRNQELNR